MKLTNTRLAVVFTTPGRVEVREETVTPPQANEVQVRGLISAISSGSEMLVYHGQAPDELPVDDTIPALSGGFGYPLKYGYSLVGEVVALGEVVNPQWLGRMVIAFHPHETVFNARPEELILLPDGTQPEDAVFLPNVETAVNFILDGQPLIGENVVVFGQGIVGLLTTALLVRFPIGKMYTVDAYPERRKTSLALGATDCFDPGEKDVIKKIRQKMGAFERYAGADLVYELSGSPATLDQAIEAAGFDGRIVIGSWYGQKRAEINLGGRFHRARIRLISSQVSSLTPSLSGRWSKERRLQVAWEVLNTIRPAQFITQRYTLGDAAEAYQLLDQHPERTIQVVLVH